MKRHGLVRSVVVCVDVVPLFAGAPSAFDIRHESCVLVVVTFAHYASG